MVVDVFDSLATMLTALADSVEKFIPVSKVE
jgi:hypothetical protein